MFNFFKKDTHQTFAIWLNTVLDRDFSDDIVAFHFNLYEDTNTFHIQLIGAPAYSDTNDDWACEEVFTTGENIFIVKRSEAGNEWKQGLSFCKNLIQQYLEKGKHRQKLLCKKAVTVGFVDGDVEVIYKK